VQLLKNRERKENIGGSDFVGWPKSLMEATKFTPAPVSNADFGEVSYHAFQPIFSFFGFSCLQSMLIAQICDAERLA
jgi:hypothetical protein